MKNRLAYWRAYYAANRERIRERQKAYFEGHRELIQARHRAYWNANRAVIKVARELKVTRTQARAMLGDAAQAPSTRDAAAAECRQ